MWFNDQQYNKLVWKNESRNDTLKQILLNDMRISLRLLYSLKKDKQIFVNKKFYKMHEIVNIGDIIEVNLPDEANEYDAEDMDIKLLYEDADLMVIEKEPFIVVHPTKGHQRNTLANGLIKLFKDKSINSKIRFVNRLDRDTSGILIVAKNSYCHSILTKNDAMHEMEKKYYAVVSGHLDKASGVIDLPIDKSEDGIRRIVSDKGQRAVTRYKVIDKLKYATLLEISLETGRTHQIRVHFSHIGHPLLGDELYGGDMSLLNRQALHCFELGFYSPRKSEITYIKSELPHDMRELVEKLSLAY
ncbi:ribosomal large subunit pseudouridylate synthase D [Acetoanaerobium sticklandii]|uniref:Pseudouridine synthase n=1 Tax=Acetoanaerobium sticklandii (strain ATCC 12662 / DSM 519 / JCM 1433 / CCUG 9281 / NCIMB 10654 / HF) TaxID=499177 RepID=E3PT53_ACESD|nr:RluA family pseudouridine synthase [Acetoanaerobium sticklandii]CBH22057.1 ribosomal large subunit pseudouridylate synthase D [Acetoanaerobium sticklandii]